MTPDPVAEGETRFGFVAVIGAPNAGKSTLVNALVGTKVTIVSRKVQTTRTPIRGLFIEGQAQVALVDTPGIFEPRRTLDEAMVEAAWTGASDADVVLLVVDAARGLDEDVSRILGKLAGHKGQLLLALNKIDHVAEKEKLLGLAKEITSRVAFREVFMIAALKGDGVGRLRSGLASLMPAGPWHFPEDDVSDAPMRLLAAEITREKIYNYLHQELPYAIAVETTDWQERRDGSVRIEQTIYVERDNQRKIVLGKGGETVKRISQASRAELSGITGHPVHLFLFVKVSERWATDPERYREMGLSLPKGRG